MILVIGATGMLGTEVCRLLADRGQAVKAMVRPTSDPTKKGHLQSWGIELVEGDLRFPDTFEAALKNVDTVISTVSSMPFSYVPHKNDIQKVDLYGMKNFIEQAEKHGVQHFIYTSFSRQIDLDFPLKDAKRTIEKQLMRSGMTYTIFRPSYFMESWFSPAVGFDVPNAKANIFGNGLQKVSYISIKDVAKCIAAGLDHPTAQNAAIELGGPQGISQLKAVKIFEDVTGKKFELQHIPVETLEARQEAAKDPMEQSFPALMRCLAKGDYVDMEKTVRDFNVELTSVREFAKNMMEPFVY
jgi:uncharacterized protein YbjT (DUF2867 family)